MRDLDHIGLHGIERELARRRLRSDFSPEVEREYVLFVRRQRAGIRTAMFAALFVSYALLPVLQPWLYGIPSQAGNLVFWLQAGVVAPMALASMAVSSALHINHLLARAIQQGTILAACLVELAQRHLALVGGYHYPSENFMLVILTAASFGGFGPLRISVGVLALTALAVFQEYRWGGDTLETRSETAVLLALALIALLGSYTTGRINRRAWLHRSHADLLSRTDALTGLPNRMNFNRLLIRSIQQARREGVVVGLMMLDVDHFKTVNDRYGHLFGDTVLRRIGQVLLEDVARRPLDLKARFGGEEMVVVWYDISPEFLAIQAEQLLASIRALSFETPDGGRVQVTASLGVTWLVPGQQATPEDLLRRADGLMYEAKTQGRNRVVSAPYAPV